MDRVVLTLGPVVFYEMEVPDELRFDTKQSITVHKYPGGKRTLDAMGPDYDPPGWSGHFFGALAEQRWKMLEALAADGKPVGMTWSSFQKTVVIERAAIRYRKFWHLEYEISVQVVDNTSAPPPEDTSVSVDGQIKSDLNFGQSLANDIRGVAKDITARLQPVTDMLHQGEQAVGDILNQGSEILGGITDAIGILPSYVTAPLINLVPGVRQATSAIESGQTFLSTAGEMLTRSANPVNFQAGVDPQAMSSRTSELSASASDSALAFAFTGGMSRVGHNLKSLISGF